MHMWHSKMACHDVGDSIIGLRKQTYIRACALVWCNMHSHYCMLHWIHAEHSLVPVVLS